MKAGLNSYLSNALSKLILNMKGNSILFLVLAFLITSLQAQKLSDDYINEWKKFYPSKAVKAGFRPSIYYYENRSEKIVSDWVQFNEQTLVQLTHPKMTIDAIDGRLLRVQAQSEVDTWKNIETHKSNLGLYSKLISQAIPTITNADYIMDYEKTKLLCERYLSIEKLCRAGQANLKKIERSDLESGIKGLTKTLNDLKGISDNQSLTNTCGNLKSNYSMAIEALESLLDFSKSFQSNADKKNSVLGIQEYNRRLSLYTDSDLDSKELSEMALKEIESVKTMMAKVSISYLRETYPNRTLPQNDSIVIKMALIDMEKDAPLNSPEYLKFWQGLADDAVDFIVKNNIATLPKNKTLKIQTAPESAGAAARIGWVASAPPFDPNPITTLNLPSIPDTLPEQEQIDFWASFNKPFNRMIVIHELYPGHYMQLKISRETPHPIRLLFPYGIYIEGWATFTEKVLLDSGWEKGNHLTLLAHLRKRLENANRAYTSVQVHCNGWNKNQVMRFSTETSLLAPQFAKSLWGRIINSPMQLTSYFLGGKQFSELLLEEKKRLDTKFDLKLFMDTIMKSGPIPIDEFYGIFKTNIPN